MSDAELANVADRTTVLAKLTPAQKERVVRTLHANGHVVGFLGDGINDSPALKLADVGVRRDRFRVGSANREQAEIGGPAKGPGVSRLAARKAARDARYL
jgi:magnesium-transporting ATPase (P-type)